MSLVVTTRDMISLFVKGGDTHESVKLKILDMMMAGRGIFTQTSDLRIIFEGKEMKSHETLSDKGTSANDTVHAIGRLRGGMPKKGIKKITEQQKKHEMQARLHYMSTMQAQHQEEGLPQVIQRVQQADFINTTIQNMSAERVRELSDVINNISRADRIPKEVVNFIIPEIQLLEDKKVALDNTIALLEEAFQLAFVEKYFHNTAYDTDELYLAVSNRITSIETEAEVQRRMAQGMDANPMQQD